VRRLSSPGRARGRDEVSVRRGGASTVSRLPTVHRGGRDPAGVLCLAAARAERSQRGQDVYSRRIVGWSMRDDLQTDLVLDALGMAVTARGAECAGVVAHSDHGSQYTSLRYGRYAKQSQIELSMGSIGDPWDNAMAEMSTEAGQLHTARAPAPNDPSEGRGSDRRRCPCSDRCDVDWSRRGDRPRSQCLLVNSESGLGIATPALSAMAASRDTWRLAPHLSLIDELLIDAAGGGERICLSLPPRHGKSELVDRWFPAWPLGTFPERRVMLASYEADFAATWGAKARDALEQHGAMFGVQVRDDSSARHRWDIAGHAGGMVTAGVGGPLTGRGADVLIIDDPVKNAEEANSGDLSGAGVGLVSCSRSARPEGNAQTRLVVGG
jgi:hypothetical protein